MSRPNVRRFEVVGDSWKSRALHAPGVAWDVAFLKGRGAEDRQVHVAVIRAGDEAWMEVKAAGHTEDFALTVGAAEGMMAGNLEGRLSKVRHTFSYAGTTFSVDVYADGLVLAEVHLDDPDAAIPRVTWLGRELSHDPFFGDRALAQKKLQEKS